MIHKIAIAADSNSGITQGEAKLLGVHIIPMPFSVDDKIYFEDISMSQKEFNDCLQEGRPVATSQPAPGDIMALWESLLLSYDEIIYIPMTSGLSGSCMSAMGLAMEYDNRVFVVDNKRISLLQRQSVLEAMELAKAGYSGQEIKTILEQHALETMIYLGVDNLQQLKKGGRISSTAAAVGTVLSIKPILRLKDSLLEVYHKTRGRHAMMQNMISAIRRDLETDFKDKEVSLYAAYAGDQEIGQAWEKAVQEAFPEFEIQTALLPMVIVCHTGVNVLGIGFAQKLEIQGR